MTFLLYAMLQHVAGNFAVEHIHLHAYAMAHLERGGANQFLAAMLLFDEIHGFIEVDIFLGIVKQTDLVIAMNEVTDPEGYRKEYLPTTQKTLKEHGGVYAAAGAGMQIDGSLPKSRVVAGRAWRH